MKTKVSKLRKNWFLQCLFTVLMMPGLVLFPVAVTANPRNPTVRAGSVNFSGLNTSSLNINQSTRNAVINWQNFSVGVNESTRFNQPSRNSLTVNRVTGGNLSSIYGQLSANGNVIVINPNGILVGPSGVIDVGGALTLSTLDASDTDLLNGGSARYRGTSGAGVTNYGAISAGDVTVLGNFISNQGSIVADRSVALGAGGDIIVGQTAEGATISVRGGAPGGGTGIENAGSVEGGNVQMATHGNSYAMAINNSGAVRAKGYNFRGGRLTLSAGRSGGIINTGNLTARRQNGAGGQINVSGGDVEIASGRVDASGSNGMDGGDIAVEGTNVTVGADALVIADGLNGGSVSIDASNNLMVAGTVSSTGQFEGGQVDLAGDLVNIESTALVDTSGLSGGRIRAGGGFQGNDAGIRNSSETNVADGALLISDGSLGDGGDVIIWSDGDTMFGGEVSARATGLIGNGGFVEISGKTWLSYLGFANTSAANGINGTLLLDPSDVTIGPAGGSYTITDADLVTAVLLNNVVIHTSSGGVAAGDITIDRGSDIQYDSPNSLSFFAHRHIFVNGDIKNYGTTDTAFTGTGHITLVAGWDGTGAGSFGFDPDTGTPGGADPSINAASVAAGTYGSYGLLDGGIFINNAAIEPVEVGSARGETNAFGDLFFMTAGNNQGEFSQFGFRRENDLRGRAITGLGADNALGGIGANADTFINTALDLDFDTGVTGDINIYANGGVFAIQHQGTSGAEGVKNNDRTYVMIGHGGIRENNNDIDRRRANNIPGGANDAPVLNNSITGALDYGNDAEDLTVGNGDNHGNITIVSGGVVSLQAARAEGHAQIGHGGLANDDPDGNRSQTASDRAAQNNSTRTIHVFGNMTGDINITAASVDLEGGRYNDAPVIIGHGGTRIRGNHGGDISITTTGGGIRVRAAPDSASGGPANSNDWRWRNNRDQSHAQIGHGGFESDFLFLDTLAGWDGATTNGGVPIGTDQYDTSGNVSRPENNLASTPVMDRDPTRTSLSAALGIGNAGQGTSLAGDGIATNYVRGRYLDSGSATIDGQLVNGGVTGVSFGHSGNITVNSAGTVEFVAANGTDAYAMIGHGGRRTHGDHVGDISVISGGSVIFHREAWQLNDRGRDISNRGTRAFVQLGHGGALYNGGSTGDIEVRAGGSVEFYAGRNQAHAQLGHGGRGEDASSWGSGRQRRFRSNGTHSGDITVVAGDDIRFRSGFGSLQAHSMLGHGGYYQQADVVSNGAYPTRTLFGDPTAPDQVGHNGDISVTSGGDISFVAGSTETLIGQNVMERDGQQENFTQMGHGGHLSKGDHYGNISITTTGANGDGDLLFESRGGWNAISIDNNNGDGNTNTIGTPRLNSGQDDGATGWRNYAMIGSGGFDAEHRNDDANNNWNNSGMNGNGIGVIGPSDININITGDLELVSAQRSAARARPLPIQALPQNFSGNVGNVQAIYHDEAGNVVTLFTPDANGNYYAQHFARLDIINRADGEVWDLPDPVFRADDAFVQIGNGGRATDYRGDSGGQFAFNTGGSVTVAGLSDDVTLTAASAATLTQNGTSLQDLIDVHNLANPGNPISVVAGDTSQIPTGNINLTSTVNNRGTTILPVDGRGHRGDIDITAGGNIRVESSDMRSSVFSGEAIEIAVTSGYTGAGAANNATVDLGGGTGLHRVGPAAGPNADLIWDRGTQNDASTSNRNYAMIGIGGMNVRGDHNVTININGDGDAGNGGNLDLIAGEGRYAFAMIGAGGFDSDRRNNDGQRSNDIGQTATININIDGKLTMQGGGLQNPDTTGLGDLNPLGAVLNGSESEGSFVQIGAGGRSTGGSHHADIDIETGNGVLLEAGNSSRGAYGQIGSGGYWGRSENISGNIRVAARAGDIELIGSVPVRDVADPDDPFAPDNTGNIAVGREAFVQIGNGGFDTDAQGGNQNNVAGDGSGYTGSIEVVAATGNVRLIAGGDPEINGDNDRYRAKYVKIGHGGPFTDGDSTGDILVTAGQDLSIVAGFGNRNGFAHIGHGNNNDNGDKSGTIEIVVGRDLLMQRGARTDANGTIVRDAFSKIGHGNTSLRYGSDGAGDRTGDIFVSVGRSMFTLNGVNGDGSITTFGAEIGHVALDRDNVGLSIGAEGDTFIAVSRNNPTGDPTLLDSLGNPVDIGVMSLSDGTSITSTDGGLTTEVRLYMPSSIQNEIQTGVSMNGNSYDRLDLGGVGNRFGVDENAAIEHTQTTGAFGEPVGTFTPEGIYNFHALGLYNIYYADLLLTDPVDPDPDAVPDGGPGGSDRPEREGRPGFNFGSFVFNDVWERFDWPDNTFLEYEGNVGHWESLGFDEAIDSTYIPRSGIESFLDSGLGGRTGVLIGAYDGFLVLDPDLSADAFAPTVGELEAIEESERREGRATRPGVTPRIFYLYEPGGNVYSSMRVFGYPSGDVPTFAPGQ